MNNRSLKKQEKIAGILDFGIQAFREKGYHSAGVQELADSCGLSKGSFYQYFQTKENFCQQVIERYSEKMCSILNELFADDSLTGLSSLKNTYSAMIDMIAESSFQCGCLYGDLAAELGGVNEKCSDALKTSIDSTNKIFKEVVQRGQEDGSIRKDLNADILAEVTMNSFSGVILKMKVDRSIRAGEQFITTFLDGMLSSQPV